MREIVETFTITSALVHEFAQLTGDQNALHTDAEFARRSRYRQRVAHGMLAVAFLGRPAAKLVGGMPRFRRLEGRFTAPVPLGSELRMHLAAAEQEHGSWTFEAAWISGDGQNVLNASGSFAPQPAILLERARAGPACLLTEPVEEMDRGADELADAQASLSFALTPAVLAGLARLIGLVPPTAPCPNLAATLLLSTLVGMRLPGRRATFTDFKATFARDLAIGEEGRLEGQVVTVSAASETLTARAGIVSGGAEAASAEIRAMINPAPRAMPSVREIRERHLGLGLEGKVAVVIGASRGIGESAAKLFAMTGARVVVHYFRGQRDAEAIAAEIAEAGGRAVALGCDIRDEAAVDRFFTEVDDAMGGLDVLVNNAVLDFRPRPVAELRWADYVAELEVSLKGLHACCNAAVPRMRQRGGGKIVNVSSVAVGHPVRGQSRYITAKSAVEGYTRSLAVELLKDRIQVNLVVPAMTETDLLASIPGDFVRRMGRARGMGRNLRPIEVAQAMVYLASGWSDAITGQKIVINLGEPPFA